MCSGYGGFELALKLAGIPTRTVAHIERDSYAAACLVARMEEQTLDLSPIWDDLSTFDPQPWAGRVDIITAGLPCQPFSVAGHQHGLDDERHLWPHAFRIIAQIRPRYVLLENVPDVIRAGWLAHVLADLATLGFNAEWGMLRASDVGAPHKRERFWLLGYTRSERYERESRNTLSGEAALSRQEGNGGGYVVDRPDQTVGDTDIAGLKGIGELNGRTQRRVGGHVDRPNMPPTLADTESVNERTANLQERTITRTDTRTDIGGDRLHVHQFPPGRDDHTGWDHYLKSGGPQPAVRRSPNGRPTGLADALHLGGNGLVPHAAAAALMALADRAGIQLH